MSLTPGTRLGVYEVTAKIGEGGMGEVYQARDTTLDRDVALKVLPEAFTADPDRLARFQREAKVLASLNHPNIGAIYGLESSEDTQALVLELIEGPTLSERIAEGPIPVDEALTIATQIADALEAAHERGIVHRDLKPANVKVRPDGTVKVLDFGLAKAVTPEASGTSGSESPTMSLTAATQMGMVIGTAAYMAPEQARGKPVDQRADIWAFGAVLFEMLTGRQAFAGETVSDTLAAVLRVNLDFDDLPADAPWRVRDILGRCLDRDPKQRFHSIADARIEMVASGELSRAPERTAGSLGRSNLLTWIPWALAVVLGTVLVASLFRTLDGGPNTDVVHFEIELPEGGALNREDGIVAAVSPDGSRIVVEGDFGTRKLLYLRHFNDLQLEPIPGTEGARSPFFSASGNWLGFVADGKLKKVALDTQTVVDLVEASWGAGAWGLDGTIIYTPSYVEGLWRVSEDGGDPEQLTAPDPERKELGHFWPQFLPGEKQVLFTNFKPPLEESRIEVLDIADGTRKVLIENAAHGLYLGAGRLMFARQETLFVVNFDPDTLEVEGQALPILADVSVNEGQGGAYLSISGNGTLVFLRASVMSPNLSLVWVDRSGNEELVVEEKRQFSAPQISPDGRRVAVGVRDHERDLWVLDLDRESLVPLTDGPSAEFNPYWTPDGTEILFNFDIPPYDIYRIHADGSGQTSLVVGDDRDKLIEGVSGQGEVVYSRIGTDDWALWRTVLAADAKPVLIHESRYLLNSASLSPDSRWIVFASNESGQFEVYVKTAIEGGQRRQVSSGGGTSPFWSPQGDEIFYRRQEQMVAVKVDTESELVIGEASVLFEGNYAISRNGRNYDVAEDGRFLMIKTPINSEPRRVSVILNFHEMLERLVSEN